MPIAPLRKKARARRTRVLPFISEKSFIKFSTALLPQGGKPHFFLRGYVSKSLEFNLKLFAFINRLRKIPAMKAIPILF